LRVIYEFCLFVIIVIAVNRDRLILCVLGSKIFVCV